MDSFGRALGEVVRVDGLAGEVGALSEHGGVLAADARVEVVLADALHHVGRGAVEEVALAEEPVHLGHAARHILLLPVRGRQRSKRVRRERWTKGDVQRKYDGKIKTAAADRLSCDELVNSWRQSCLFYSNAVAAAASSALKLDKNIGLNPFS